MKKNEPITNDINLQYEKKENTNENIAEKLVYHECNKTLNAILKQYGLKK